MARMKTGRLTPKTTDPQGNRIADPSLVGVKLPNGGTVSSWPEVRKMYQSGGLKDDFQGRAINKDVKNYLEGKTNKLSDTEYDEPVLRKVRSNDMVNDRNSVDMNYKPGGKMYQALEKKQESFGAKPKRAPGMVNQYDSGESSTGSQFGVGETPDLGYYKRKPEPPTKTSDTIEKMPIRKPTTIATKKGKIEQKPEPAAFVNPNKKAGSNAPSMNLLAGGAKTKGSGKRYVKQVINSIGGPNNRGYKKEENLFKAKAGTSASGIDFSNMSSGEIKQKRQDLKSDRRDYRKGTDSDAKIMAIKEAGMDIRQSRKAQTYTKKMEGGGKPFDFFTPSYKKEESPRAVNRIIEYKDSQDNANNRNNMQSKLKSIGEKSKKGSFGNMPTS
jgi:hypothetical protein